MTLPTTLKSRAKAQRTVTAPAGSPGVAQATVPLAMTFDELIHSDDAPEETADDIVRAVQEWRNAPSNRGLA
jgi:hypothetical protein